MRVVDGVKWAFDVFVFFFGTPPSVTFFFSLAAFPSLSLSLSPPLTFSLSLLSLSISSCFFFVIIIFLCSELSLRLM